MCDNLVLHKLSHCLAHSIKINRFLGWFVLKTLSTFLGQFVFIHWMFFYPLFLDNALLPNYTDLRRNSSIFEIVFARKVTPTRGSVSSQVANMLQGGENTKYYVDLTQPHILPNTSTHIIVSML